MRRLPRILILGLSMLLFTAICVLWMISERRSDMLVWKFSNDDDGARESTVHGFRSITSTSGGLQFESESTARSGRVRVNPESTSFSGPCCESLSGRGFDWVRIDFPTAYPQVASGGTYQWVHRRGDFEFAGTDQTTGGKRLKKLSLTLPYWSLALAGALLPGARILRFCWRRRRRPAYACRTCGYDLRATPDRCPECGAAAKSTGGRGG